MTKILKISTYIAIITLLTSCSTTKNIDNSNRDGLSFKQAIVVNSITEKYQYVKKVCADCDFVMQSLVFKNDNPYDVLKFEKPDGKKVSYYFDISKFFGKVLK